MSTVNSKCTRMMSITLLLCLFIVNCVHHCSEPVISCWVSPIKHSVSLGTCPPTRPPPPPPLNKHNPLTFSVLPSAEKLSKSSQPGKNPL